MMRAVVVHIIDLYAVAPQSGWGTTAPDRISHVSWMLGADRGSQWQNELASARPCRMPMDRTIYPKDWDDVAHALKERAGWRCETPCVNVSCLGPGSSGIEERFGGPMKRCVVWRPVLPAAPQHAHPGSGKYAYGMGVVAAASSRLGVHAQGPRRLEAGV